MCREPQLSDEVQISSSSLLKVIGAFREPAFLVVEGGIVVFANDSAREVYDSPPEWLASVPNATRSASVRRIATSCRIDLRDRKMWLVLPKTPRVLSELDGSRPGILKALPPSLERVARLIILGFSDKEIAECTNLTVSSVRTYTGRIYRRLRINGRQELMATVLAELQLASGDRGVRGDDPPGPAWPGSPSSP